MSMSKHPNLKSFILKDAGRKLNLGVFIGLLILFVAIPYKHSKGALYTGEIILALCMLIDLYMFSNTKLFILIVEKNPFSLWILIFATSVFLSVPFSHYAFYSFKQFMYEIVINITLYYVLIFLFVRNYIGINKITKLLIAGNITFICAYFLQGIEWYFLPSHPFLRTVHGIEAYAHIYEAYFNMASYSNLFSYKALTTYTLFFISLALAFLYSTATFTKKLLIVLLGCGNLALVFLSLLKASIVAITFSFLAIFLLPHRGKKRVLFCVMIIVVAITVSIVAVKPLRKRFFRSENISNVIRGKLGEKGSFSVRIRAYRVYLDYIFTHPFVGVGIGRRNIKKALPELTKESRLVHGHNVFINYAVQTGIQGALALICLILIKFKHALKYLRSCECLSDPKCVFVTAYVFWLCMFWTRSSFDDMFRHNFSTFYWIIASIFTYCIISRDVKV